MNDRDSRYVIPVWVASRFFASRSDLPRVAISNERDHEFVTLEGDSANVWNFVSEAADSGVSSAELAARFPSLSPAIIEAFLEELQAANLICDVNVTNSSSRPRRSESIAGAGRYAGGSYVEPAAGGDNLAEEFEFQDWAKTHGYLWSLAWEMTYRCNESCIHCFNPGASHGPGTHPQRKTKELNLIEAQQMLLEAKELGVFRLLLTGGEVALRKDFFEILKHARKLGFSVTIFTNGTLFDEASVNCLSDLYPHRIEMTLYADREKHDLITGLRGSFDKTVQVARAFVEKGITVAIKTTVMRDTAHDHHALRELCSEIGCEYYPDFNMSAGVDGARSPLTELSLHPADLITNALNESTALWVGTIDAPRRMNLGELHGQPVCGAGHSLMALSPEGHVYPCNSLPIHMGSTREAGLREVWLSGRYGLSPEHTDDPKGALAKWQRVVRGSYHVCGKFDRCAWCQKCPGMAFLESGDELAPSYSNCRIAAARRIAFDLLREYGSNAAQAAGDIDRLQERYAQESSLWGQEHLESRISLSAVKSVLKSRTKAQALQRDDEIGAGDELQHMREVRQ